MPEKEHEGEEMYYEVYADSLYLINFVMDLYLLMLVDRSSFHTSSPRRLMLGAAVGAGFYLLPFWGGGSFWLKQLAGYAAGTLLMLFLAFPIRSAGAFFRILEKMFLYTLLLGGLLLFLFRCFPNLRTGLNNVLGVMGAGAAAALMLRHVSLQSRRETDDPVCRATLIRGGEKVTVDALLDSGNSLTEPISGKPVCIVAPFVWEKLWQGEPEGFRAVPYHCIGKKRGILRGYLLPELRLDTGGPVKVFRSVCVAVSEEGMSEEAGRSVGMIVNPQLFKEGLMGGGRGRPEGQRGIKQEMRRKNISDGGKV